VSVVLSKFFKSRWSEQQITSKLEEALQLLADYKGVSPSKIKELRKEAKDVLKL